ncbi:carboxylating nicotinate-nucleotide diphosphorylase [Roseburia sp. 1XD42-34]|nr:carboxylating nicotinate-nucleotide diphosphorylase [Roseburia sp. 1XD42-34]RKI82532.1 carboxylating nicotinate-nucleotide diphosphorylase [Clostridium sp. 1xD42-85]
MNLTQLNTMLNQFYLEDIGYGDMTSQNLFDTHMQGTITFHAKEPGIFCGAEIIDLGFQMIHTPIQLIRNKENGDQLEVGDVIATASGSIIHLLQVERVILNLLQRMSGIATITSKAVQMVKETEVKICDTRKTTPGLRMLEKQAVRCGGGYNHRYGLSDAVMIKDNHIAFSGSITNAVQRIKSRLGHTVKIEVEIESEAQLLEAIANEVDIIMFDNCSPERIRNWIHHVPKTIITEASGGIQFEQLLNYAKSGIDFISLGYLTHAAPSLDISASVYM